MIVAVKLSEWAKANGVSRQSACRWFHAGVLAVPARQLATGTILVEQPPAGRTGVALHARVSSGDQREDSDRQVARLAGHTASMGVVVSKVVSEVGSGLKGHRAKLLCRGTRKGRKGRLPPLQGQAHPPELQGDHRQLRGGRRPPRAPASHWHHPDQGVDRQAGKAGLNWAILDVAPGGLRRQLACKSTWYGSTLVVAKRWYPSSKTCSGCKAVKAKLALSERTYRCEHCGLFADRDANAAANLASLVESVTDTGTASGAGTSTLLRRGSHANAQGDDKFMPSGRWSSTNCEGGSTAPQGQQRRTVTATRQRVAPKPVLVGGDR